MADTEPTLAEIFRVAIDSRLLDVHIAIPGRVETFYPGSTTETPCADVLPLVHRALPGEDESIVTETLPIIPCVPVLFPRGSGDAFSITWPLAPGDSVELVFQHADIAAWRDTGQPSAPNDLRRHGLGSCVAIPGLGKQMAPLKIDPSAMVLTGDIKVDLTATAYAALDTLVRARLVELFGAINAATVIAGDGGAKLKADIISALGIAGWSVTDVPSVACTKLKVL